MKYATFPLLVSLSLLVGRSIPAFYDWTGSDQSRPSPLILPIAIGMLVSGGLVCLALPWLPLPKTDPGVADVKVFRFRIRTLLVLTAAVALCLALFRSHTGIVLSGCGFMLACVYAIRAAILIPSWRWPTAALFACMYFPYAWIVTYGDPAFGSAAKLSMATGLPALLPTLSIGGLVGQHPKSLEWLPILLASGELWFGAWLIQLGPRRTLAYLIAVGLASTFGSFVLNALVRM